MHHIVRALGHFSSIVVLLLLLMLTSPATAQQLPAPRDTSFSTHSAYTKAKKQYPNISIARPLVPRGVKSQANVAYCTRGTHALQLDVFYTKHKRRQLVPAVLIVHGGGWRSGDRSQHVPLAQQLAGKGYVAVTAEYRLSTEAPYPAAVLDLKAAIRWMRANAHKYSIDTTRIAVWGFSAGGQLAALVGTTNGASLFEDNTCYPTHSSNVQAIVDADGILAFIHPESGEGDDRKNTSAATYWFGSPKTEHPELWEQASALTHVSAQTPPMLFINSGVDRMHAGRDDVRRKLEQYGVYTEMHQFPEAPHPFPLFNPWFEPTVQYTIDFLNKVFKTH
ncbi:alpha/beta hydrolase [Hymenobacter taeanensis]|uniref:Alpha/beta hydrolase n=1 Tax=Hymenobacter taeanensis TaxID=2735321 RepID=A0A6M6BIY0_9BACT|nr:MULTISPECIES: alpha/beta hydrolase [Hymenobacter]QJX48521.1 alpha/beta hydrolase [Hymenobacter taeanensis]UOQ81981.1 alpha/beta hydrolase [Hymenobacter sp. 5414T-23]